MTIPLITIFLQWAMLGMFDLTIFLLALFYCLQAWRELFLVKIIYY